MTSDAPLSARLVSRQELTHGQRASMLQLLASHFSGVETEVFDRDLNEKNWVILLEDASGRLLGFTTLLVYPSQITTNPTLIVSSGDTIVEPEAWGSLSLHKTWIESVYRLHSDYPSHDLNWLLLTSGFRTYRFLPIFCKEFFPRFDTPPPPTTKRLMHALAFERYGDKYDAEKGIVRFDKPQSLRAHLSHVDPGRKRDPHVAYFLASNPGYSEGDELLSFASLMPENLTSAGRRMANAVTPR